MGIWRAIAWFYLLGLVAFVVVSSPPFLHSFSSTTPCFEGGRKLSNMHDEARALLPQGFQRNDQGRIRGGEVGGNSGKGVEESTREVPTGPDPLHHRDIDPSGSGP